jgi:hypothetical protein
MQGDEISRFRSSLRSRATARRGMELAPRRLRATSQKGNDITGLIAGYVTGIAAMLIAAATAFTIIYSVNRLPSTDEELSTEETVRKVAA